MNIPKLNGKKSKVSQLIQEPTPKEAITAVAPNDSTESTEPKKSAQQKDAEKVKGTLENLRDDKQSVSRSKVAKLTGQVPKSVNVYGSHFPVVRMLNDGKTLLLHTSNYGNDGKTTQLVEKIKGDLPDVFPDAKVIEIHHPDYRHSAKVMRIRDEGNVHQYLEHASQKHPDENYRQHAAESLEHLRGIKKAEYSKPIHAKRTENEGWDYDKNVQGRLSRLHQYLSRIGLTSDLSSDVGRKLGAAHPTSVTINKEGDPHDQQVLHEAGHAMLTPAGKTLGEYQAFIGKPGFEGKIQASAHRKEMQQMHGGGMPEQTAQQMEAGIARRAGIEPFRSPKRGTKPSSAEEGARAHAKKTLDMYDQGIQSFDPFTGQNELGSSIDAVINSKTIGNEDIKNRIRQKFKEHKIGHQDLENDLAASEKNYLSKNLVDEMFEILAKGSLQRKNPFNPHDQKNQTITSKQRLWTHDEDDDHRQTLPKMEGSARLRALNKLSAKTHVRKDPSSGERLFLMHRGMGSEELKGSNSGGIAQYEKGVKTSWTPDKDVAHSFGSRSNLDDKTNVVSAWIPESAISHSVNQFNAPTPESIKSAKEFNKPKSKGKDYTWQKTKGKSGPVKIQKQKNRSVTEREEAEWIVEHNQPFQHAHPKFTERAGKHALIGSWTEPLSEGTDPSFKASIGAKQFKASQDMQGEDKKQAYHSGIQAKGKIASDKKKEPAKTVGQFLNQKTKSKIQVREINDELAASESDKILTEDDLPKVKKPFQSKKQRRFAYANPEKFGGKKGIKEWESKTPKNIPESVKKRDIISGGLADGKKPSDFDKKKLKAGVKVESEHTSNRKVAQEIAMDHLTEDKDYYKKLKTIEKMEIPKPIKTAALVTALASAGHQMVDESRVKPQSREVASRERVISPQDQAYENAYSEGMKTRYLHDFKNKPSKVIIREMIKKHPDLSESHGYMLKLGPNAFKEVVQHNEPLVKEVGSRYYDHLHNLFQGDQDKIERAWFNNIKGAKEYIPEKN
jgi:hypothetical protein